MNWSIQQLDRKTADGFVTTAHWTCTATDGDFSANAYGSVGFSGDLVTPYENLTQEQVLGWVWEQIDKSEIEANLTKQIQAQKNPVSVAGVPWNQENNE
jgi:hypothetical protein